MHLMKPDLLPRREKEETDMAKRSNFWRKKEMGKGKTITISPELEQKIVSSYRDDLDWFIKECDDPAESEDKIEAMIEILRLLGYKEDADNFEAGYKNALEEAQEDEDDGTLSYRVVFASDEDKCDAENLLDDAFEDYDYDSGDRMMVNQSGLDRLYASNIDFDEV